MMQPAPMSDQEWLLTYVQATPDVRCPRCRSPLVMATPSRCDRCRTEMVLSLGTATPFSRIWAATLGVLMTGSGFGLFLGVLWLWRGRLPMRRMWLLLVLGVCWVMFCKALGVLFARHWFWRSSIHIQFAALAASVLLLALAFSCSAGWRGKADSQTYFGHSVEAVVVTGARVRLRNHRLSRQKVALCRAKNTVCLRLSHVVS